MKMNLGDGIFLTFLILKLTDNIDWSWWWITCPLWGGVIISVLFAMAERRVKEKKPETSRFEQRMAQMREKHGTPNKDI